MLTPRIARILAPTAAVLLCAAVANGQTQQLPTAATTATVTADKVTVFAEMDRSSEAVRSLAKGDSVYVDLRIDQGGMKWCGIRLQGQPTRAGYADCRNFVRTSVPMITGNSGAAASSGGARSVSSPLPLAQPKAPTLEGYTAIRNDVVKDGVVDSAYIAIAETQARSGGAAAVTRAALAHLAAGEFELGQHEPDKAIEHFEAMLPYCGNQRGLSLANFEARGYALLMKSEYGAALDLVEQARKIAPQSAELAAMSGYAHYRLNQLDTAIIDLQLAQKIHPQENTAVLLERARRDKDTEGDFSEGQSNHFVVRYHGGASRQLASEVIHTLEAQFQELRGTVNYTPAEPITVILYARETFRDVTGVPDWAGALNDGRIRVAAQGIDSVPDPLARSLKHELTHSFLFQKTQGRCPTWLQEGMAQWISGKRIGPDAAQLLAIHESGHKTLRALEGSWMKYSSAESWFAYGWALATVEMINSEFGNDGLDRLLNAERSESSGEAALREGLRMNFSNLDDETVQYLKKTYLQ